MTTIHPIGSQALNMSQSGSRGQIAVQVPDPPSETTLDRAVTLLEPLSLVVRPKLYGLDRVPADGSLLVGNHTIYGFLDLPFMMAEIWRRRRLAIRGLGEHAHYAVPLWRDLLATGGRVRGTRDNLRALMRSRQTVLVFPGGSREVNKRKRQQYQLLWRERIGFARLALEFDYPIVPFAAVGADDMLDVIIDQNTPVNGPLARVYEKHTGFPTPPIVRGVGPTPDPAARAAVLLVRRADRARTLSHRRRRHRVGEGAA
jgi:1-acyl-sn-glycerol-3-phosphate acyltransferase